MSSLEEGLIKGDIIIPETFLDKPVTAINERAFIFCENLNSILIPTSIKYIGRYAFIGCSRLSNISIPGSVLYLNEDTFNGCNFSEFIIEEGDSPLIFKYENNYLFPIFNSSVKFEVVQHRLSR